MPGPCPHSDCPPSFLIFSAPWPVPPCPSHSFVSQAASSFPLSLGPFFEYFFSTSLFQTCCAAIDDRGSESLADTGVTLCFQLPVLPVWQQILISSTTAQTIYNQLSDYIPEVNIQVKRLSVAAKPLPSQRFPELLVSSSRLQPEVPPSDLLIRSPTSLLPFLLPLPSPCLSQLCLWEKLIKTCLC